MHKLLVLRVGSVLVALGLIGLGAMSLVAPHLAAASFGAPTDDAVWVTATGCRDAVLGILLLLLLREPRALAWCFSCLLVLPVCDAVLVSSTGAPLPALVPHLGGAVVLLGLSALAWSSLDRKRGARSAA